MNENREPHKQDDIFKPEEQDAQADHSNCNNSRLEGANIGNLAPRAKGNNLISASTIIDSTFIGTQNNYQQAPPTPPKGTPSNLPYSGVPEAHFVGRNDTLAELHKQLQQNNQLAICAVSGMGGIGKTELAVQYAIRHQDEYPGGLCWLPCRETNLLGTKIVNFALSIITKPIPHELKDLQEQINHCWNHWPEGTVLVIYDDVIDYAALAPYLPPRNKTQFKVLMTSRQKPGANYQRINLDVLDVEAALKLLRSLVGNERINAELEQAEGLCEWLGRLPLALELVGRYLAGDQELTIEKVQKRLESKSLAAKALILKNQGDTTAQLGVAAAFELSWEQLSEQAKELGCRLSLFAPAPIQWSLVEQCVIKTGNTEAWEDEQEELCELRNQELIEQNLLQISEHHEYRLHPLIREFFKAKHSEIENIDECKRDLCRVMVLIAKQVPEIIDLKLVSSLTFVVPHLVEVANNLLTWIENESLILPCQVLGKFYLSQSIYSEAENWYQKNRNIIFKQFDVNHLLTAIVQNDLADLYSLTGQYKKADEFYKKALNIKLEQLEDKHPDLANIYNNLGNLYVKINNYQEAQLLYQQALNIWSLEEQKNILNLATVYNNLALLDKTTENFNEARINHEKALELLEKQPVKDYNLLTQFQINLAEYYRTIGEFKKAQSIYEDAIKILVRQFGEKHYSSIAAFNNLALLYMDIGQYNDAEFLYQKALTLQKDVWGEKHCFLINTYTNLVTFYCEVGEYNKSDFYRERILELIELNLENNYLDIAKAYNNIAEYFSFKGDYEQADLYFNKALTILQKQEELNNNLLGTIYHNLGSLNYQEKKIKKAKNLFLKAKKFLQQSPEFGYITLMKLDNNLSLVYAEEENYKASLYFQKRALLMAENKLGKTHSTTLKFLLNLGCLYYKMKNFQAELIINKALSLIKINLGEKHPDMAINFYNLAVIFQSSGSYSQAITYYQKALEIAVHRLGEKHPHTTMIQNNYNTMLLELSEKETLKLLPEKKHKND
ncbi:tetratricopeptide repeat protein [Aphanothece hegewaldii CCALA 016]|uniref:Tetratricopeptide repeat protein n=1 Tax=Aphanothece hegewaldii CCALA 016 TaxID=2107694 RepID=A0A2T1LUE5_9CHRO|nr:tetratricopeptide repeat protein [Aphanothece hegewaldii]PSF34939.1 tetratricopeptide repeat protein [Aphanothece hegewaldii CCALA 016]